MQIKDIIEVKIDDNLKKCKKCGQHSLEIEYLGTSDTGTKVFEATCILGCTNYIFCIDKDKNYYRSGNLYKIKGGK